eukprot:418102-Karenia_brevis.AAC.1
MASSAGHSGLKRLPVPKGPKNAEELKTSAWFQTISDDHQKFKAYGLPPSDAEFNIPWVMAIKGKCVVQTHKAYPFSTIPHWISNIADTIWILSFPIQMVEK